MLTTGKLGFGGLVALVFGLVVGVGIYNLPQNMAASASPLAVAIAWLTTSAGILPLVIAFKWLSEHYPQYNAGIYQYAQAGFGNYTGFNIAWGYWLCTAFSNVTYGVMLSDSVGAFVPVLMHNNLATMLFCSALIWLMYYIVSRGIRTAKVINTFLAVIKFAMIGFVIVIFILFFKLDLFESNLWSDTGSAWSVFEQIKGSMMVTIFCFFGIEGAVMMSARAKRPRDVGRAGIAGFAITLVLYLAVSLLCFGLMRKAELAGLPDPSIAYLLLEHCGAWAYWFVIIGVIIALLGGWVAWTLVVAQVPYEAAMVGILPPIFKHTNRHGMPSTGLIASSIAMEVFMLMVVFVDDMYMTALHITSLMIVPCYFMTGLYLYKVGNTLRLKIVATVIMLFCLWMAYAGGIVEMLQTSVFYLAGIGFYYKARRCDTRCLPRTMTRGDILATALLTIIAALSIALPLI